VALPFSFEIKTKTTSEEKKHMSTLVVVGYDEPFKAEDELRELEPGDCHRITSINKPEMVVMQAHAPAPPRH
jgi:hypothetical protein